MLHSSAAHEQTLERWFDGFALYCGEKHRLTHQKDTLSPGMHVTHSFGAKSVFCTVLVLHLFGALLNS